MAMVAETNEEVQTPVVKRSYNKRVKIQEADKPLRLRTLLANGQDIWVQNNTAALAKSKKVKPGTIVLQVGEGENRDKILIPPVDPVCISDQADVDSIKKCRDLSKAIEHGALILLPPEKAEEYYRQNAARLGISQKKITDEREMVKEAKLEPVEVAQSTVEVDPNVIDICLTLKHPAENRTEAERINMAMERLRERAGTYTEEDLNYLLNNGKFAPIKAWAKKEIAKLPQAE